MLSEPEFTVGIEEEYMLVDVESRELARHVPDSLFAECSRQLGDRVAREFMQCQIEVGTGVCQTVSEAQAELVELREGVQAIAQKYDLALLAASTHPFSRPTDQAHTRINRYDRLAVDLQAVVRRLMICGMHVHVGVSDDDLRIEMMGQATYILPHLLALSTSSPFWYANNTGMKSYRLSVWDEMPRTGLPPVFESYAEYQRHVDVLVNVGIIEDATKLWWDIRPSARFPTLEVRISDVCTHVADAACITALYQCWLRMLYRLRRDNQRWRRYHTMLIDENRWRAHRYGLDGGLIDFGKTEIIPYEQLFDEIVTRIREDAEALQCVEQVEHGREILKRGTSAHQQLAHFDEALASGKTEQAALYDTVGWLMQASLS